jgi:hypothetical protein
MRRSIILGALVGLLVSSCLTSEDQTISTATKAGYSEVVPLGLDFFECSEDDRTGRGFRGKNAQGELVEGVVCCANFKGCTIRF